MRGMRSWRFPGHPVYLGEQLPATYDRLLVVLSFFVASLALPFSWQRWVGARVKPSLTS